MGPLRFSTKETLSATKTDVFHSSDAGEQLEMQ
jgi:hypothetical protein